MHYIGRPHGVGGDEGRAGGKHQAADEGTVITDDKEREASGKTAWARYGPGGLDKSEGFVTPAAKAQTCRPGFVQVQGKGDRVDSNDILRQARDREKQDRNRAARGGPALGYAPAGLGLGFAPKVPPPIPILGLKMPDTNRKKEGNSSSRTGKYSAVASSGYGAKAMRRSGSAPGANSSRLTGYDSSRPPPGFDSSRVTSARKSSVATSRAGNISSARLGRSASRQGNGKMPSLEEIARAIEERPHLRAQIVAIRDDTTIDKQRRMWEIARLVNEGDQGLEPTPLEKLQSEFNATMAQKAGRRAATIEQVKRAKAADQFRVCHPVNKNWDECGGEAIESMLQHVDLIDARFLISLAEQGGILPRWQNLPEAARINRSNVWRLYGWEPKMSLGIVIVSYPWLDKAHPDREGEWLAKLAPVLRCMLPHCGGEQYTVGVLWDYASLPQPIRNPAEATRYRGGLRELINWFAHPFTHVLLLTGELPSGAEYKNRRPYMERGWCELERRAAYLAKSVTCLWDIKGFKPEQLDKFSGARRFDVMRNQLILAPGMRAPPMSPYQLSTMMQRKVQNNEIAFSEPEDLELIIEMYQRGFVGVFQNYRRFDPSGVFRGYMGMAWTADEAKQLAGALAYASEKCKVKKDAQPIRLSLEGNIFDEEGRKKIQQAVQYSKLFGGIMF